MRTLKIASVLLIGLVAGSVLAEGCSKKPGTSQPASDWAFDAKEAARRQDESAKALGVPKELTLDLGKNVKMKLVLIPAGTFMMGSPKDEKGRGDDEAQHEVEITKPFYMGIYHVTKGQFAAFVADSGYKTGAEKRGCADAWDGTKSSIVWDASWRKPSFDQTDEHPVVCINQDDAMAFCDWLSKKVGMTAKLPSEAQWEYACRAGTATAYQWGDAPDDGKGWCNAADQTAKKTPYGSKLSYFSWDDGYTFTSPVGTFKANAWGLYDMHGNAMQWCADGYDKDYYGNSPKADPQVPPHGPRVSRGGSWASPPMYCRSACRLWGSFFMCVGNAGFRVVVTAD